MSRRVARCLFSATLLLAIAAPSLAGSDATLRPWMIESRDTSLVPAQALRHRFAGRFSASLTRSEVRALRRRGIAVRPVVLHELSAPPGACTPWPACKEGGDDGDAGRSALPSDPTPWGIELLYGGDLALTSGGAGVRVAILDTGVDTTHPDLTGRVADCADFTAKGRRGRVRVGSCRDDHGHGSHVAGTVLADGGADGLGIFGVAPEAELLAYKVCGSDGCWGDDIAAAIERAAAAGAHVVSLSLGAQAESALIRDAIAAHPELLFVAAAGNDGPTLGSIDWPGANPAVVAVGALDAALAVPSWSSRGVNDGDFTIEAREVELAAPGVAVESTWPGGGYAVLSGTSMATPHVSGLAAKLWQGSADATRAMLRSLASDVWDAGDDPATGLGLPSL